MVWEPVLWCGVLNFDNNVPLKKCLGPVWVRHSKYSLLLCLPD